MTQASISMRDRSPEPSAPTAPAPAAPQPASKPSAPPAPRPPAPAAARPRGGRRFFLLVVVPLAALALGLLWWLSGGRWVSTDNAYVGADKALITPNVTGPIVSIHVKEGQKVAAGDPLFDIDPAPYRTALALAQGRLAAAKVDFANLRETFITNIDQIKMGQDAVDLRQADYDRKQALIASRSVTRVEADTSAAALVQAKQILEFVRQQQDAARVKLGGGPDVPIETFPAYIQAKAQVEDAERNLAYASVKAPIAGVATQVAQIELGRVAPAGQPVFAVVADTGLWVDGNPKESDLTYVKVGPARDGDGRYVPRPGMARKHLLDRAGHGRAIRDPAAAERQRQLGESGAAHPAALLFRRRSGHDRLARRHERGRFDRHRAHPFARGPLSSSIRAWGESWFASAPARGASAKP